MGSLRIPFPVLGAAWAVGPIDGIGRFLLGLIAAVFLLFAVLILVSVARPRASAPIRGVPGFQFLLGTVSFGLASFLFVWSVRASPPGAAPPPGLLDIRVVAKQWMWMVQHPEGQRELNELHIPVNVPIRVTLRSQDVVHEFFVPALPVQQPALPGRETTVWFRADRIGDYQLQCSQFCGTNHSRMSGTVHVTSAPDYEVWLRGGVRDQSPEQAGETLFKAFRCDTCHNADPKAPGPPLNGAFGKPVTLKDGTTIMFDEAYAKESILDPPAKVVSGFEPLMQSYRGQLNEEQVSQIVAYLKALK